MNELFVDPFASHVYQAVLQTLNGRTQVNIVKRKKRKARADEATPVPTPEFFAELKLRLITSVRGWDQSLLQNLVLDKYAVPLLQLIIESDVPKNIKEKSKSGNRTLAQVILCGGGDINFDERGIFVSFVIAHYQYIESSSHSYYITRLEVEY